MPWFRLSRVPDGSPRRSRAPTRDEARFYREWRLVALLSIGILSLFIWMEWGKSLGHVIYDQFHRWRASLPANDIVIIGVDDASLVELGGWPLNRSVYADLLRKLADTHNYPKAIGFDILFQDPNPADHLLAEQIARHNTYLSVETPRQNSQFSLEQLKSLSVLTRAGQSVGHIKVTFENDGFLRGADLQDGRVPHLALAVSGQSVNDYRTHDGYRRFTLVDPKIGFPMVPLAVALSDEFPIHVLKDKYVLIGAIAPSLGDHFPTIYSGREGSGTPGVMLHANLLNDILRKNLITPVSTGIQWALSVFALISVLIALMVLSPLAELMVSLVTIITALVFSFILLLVADLWFDPGLCILAIVFLKPAWAWRRTEMIVHFMGERAAQLEKVQHQRKTLARGGLKWRHFASDTVLQYSRLLDRAIRVANERMDFLNRVVTEIPTAMLVADATQRILLASPRMHADIPAGLLKEREPLEPLLFYLGVHQAAHLEDLSSKDHYVSVLDIQGNLRYYIFRVAYLPQTEEGGLWVLALTDITELRQFQAQREQTLQLLSHDMRTPIASILALSRQICVESEGQHPVAVSIQRHADTLLDMMDDFIISIKAQAQHYKLTENLLDSLVDEAIFQVKDLAHARQMKVVHDFDDDPPFILADSKLFIRMLVNLLINAVRYGQSGTEIHLCLSHDSDTLQAPMVHLCISNVVGPAQSPPKVRDAAGRGFGLGLEFVKMVVRKHSGRIQLDLPTQVGAIAKANLQIPLILLKDRK